MNVGKCDGAYSGPVLQKVQAQDLEFCALQEVDLTPENGLPFQSFYREDGLAASRLP